MQQRDEKHVRQPQHQDDQTPRYEEAGHDPAGAQSAHQGEERGEGLFFYFFRILDSKHPPGCFSSRHQLIKKINPGGDELFLCFNLYLS